MTDHRPDAVTKEQALVDDGPTDVHPAVPEDQTDTRDIPWVAELTATSAKEVALYVRRQIEKPDQSCRIVCGNEVITITNHGSKFIATVDQHPKKGRTTTWKELVRASSATVDSLILALVGGMD